jgi:hypothetical protein
MTGASPKKNNWVEKDTKTTTINETKSVLVNSFTIPVTNKGN